MNPMELNANIYPKKQAGAGQEVSLANIGWIFTKNLAKLDDGLAESPTVMVVDKTKKQKTIFGKNRGILQPSWAFVENNT
jgi:hypothetical protein